MNHWPFNPSKAPVHDPIQLKRKRIDFNLSKNSDLTRGYFCHSKAFDQQVPLGLLGEHTLYYNNLVMIMLTFYLYEGYFLETGVASKNPRPLHRVHNTVGSLSYFIEMRHNRAWTAQLMFEKNHIN